MTDTTSPAPTSSQADPLLDMIGAPLPTKETLRRRNDLLIQFGKFTGFMLSMVKMVIQAHGKTR